MDMNIREFILNILKYVAVIKNIPIRKKSSLDTYLSGIDLRQLSLVFSRISGIDMIYPSSFLNAQNLHVPMHIFVKFMFLLMT